MKSPSSELSQPVEAYMLMEFPKMQRQLISIFCNGLCELPGPVVLSQFPPAEETHRKNTQWETLRRRDVTADIAEHLGVVGLRQY